MLPNADDLFESNIAGDGWDNGGETSGELLLRARCVKAACHGGDCGVDPFDWSVVGVGGRVFSCSYLALQNTTKS